MDQAANQNIRFVYTTGRSGRKATIAYMYDDSANAIRYAVAECSTRDRFVKKIGRDVASGRLVSGRGANVASYSLVGGTKYGEVAKFLVSTVS